MTEPKTTDMDSLKRMVDFLKLRAAERRIVERFDRCCHGGNVSFRLPLFYRLDCANGRYLAQ